MNLRILITNYTMNSPSGTVLYTRDLALELQHQGHQPAVYTWLSGAVSEELNSAGILVTDDFSKLKFTPDIIHGHHNPLTYGALLHYPGTPAIYFCHDHIFRYDKALIHPNVYRYFGVSALCIERLLRDGAPETHTEFRANFVDLKRFLQRSPLPKRPQRALVFSNYAKGDTHLPAIQEACRRVNLPLDVIGKGAGNLVEHPEEVLGNYDIVFAKAKAAMEAMAVGTAVVLCDFGGVGPMVTTAGFDQLRPLNFGYQALGEPLQPENIMRQIEHYDPQDAAKVSDQLRSCASLETSVAELVSIYQQVINESRGKLPAEPKWTLIRMLSVMRYHWMTAWFVKFYRMFGIQRPNLSGPEKYMHVFVRFIARRLLGIK